MSYKQQVKGWSMTQLRARRTRLGRELPDVTASVRGALQQQFRRCGNPGCRCHTGELHGPYTYLALRTGTRTRLVYIPAVLAREVRRRVKMTGRLLATLEKISVINLELITRGELR